MSVPTRNNNKYWSNNLFSYLYDAVIARTELKAFSIDVTFTLVLILTIICNFEISYSVGYTYMELRNLIISGGNY